MRTWKEVLDFLTRAPHGFSADGRTLGLGLATALARSRRDLAADVEEYLHRRAENVRHPTASS
jgi:hypothetical protein